MFCSEKGEVKSRGKAHSSDDRDAGAGAAFGGLGLENDGDLKPEFDASKYPRGIQQKLKLGDKYLTQQKEKMREIDKKQRSSQQQGQQPVFDGDDGESHDLDQKHATASTQFSKLTLNLDQSKRETITINDPVPVAIIERERKAASEEELRSYKTPDQGRYSIAFPPCNHTQAAGASLTSVCAMLSVRW